MDRRLERRLLEDRDLSHRRSERNFPAAINLARHGYGVCLSKYVRRDVEKSKHSMMRRLFLFAVRLYGHHEERVR
jgi:hypothetical protein